MTTPKRTLPPNFRKKHGDLSYFSRKAAKLVVDTGIAAREALSLCNNGKTPSPKTVRRVEERVQKYRLTHPRMVKLARDVVLDTLRGNCQEVDNQIVNRRTGEVVDFKEKVIPTVTNRLAAAAMVYDRAEPTVHQNLNVNLNADVSPVDLGKWMNRGPAMSKTDFKSVGQKIGTKKLLADNKYLHESK